MEVVFVNSKSSVIKLSRSFNIHPYKIIAIVLCITLMLPWLPGGQVNAATLFSDDFESANSDQWTATTGTWSVVKEGSSNVYAQTSTSEGRTSAGNVSWNNYTIQADVKVDNFNGTNRTYVAGRYKDGNNYYAASLYNKIGRAHV